MTRAVFAVTSLLLFSGAQAFAAEKTIVILPLDSTRTGNQMSNDARASIEEEIRDEAANALASTASIRRDAETAVAISTLPSR
jgi:GTP-sensing pleiotropic transcriptional regulator CodY